MTSQLLRRLRPLHADSPVDVRVRDGVIVDVGNLTPGAAEEVRDFDGRRVMPGLVDHHVHVTQWATLSRRLDLSASASASDATARVAAALSGNTDEVFVGFGFRAPLWTDRPTVAGLDAATGARPVVLASADLHSVWLNSAALHRFGYDPADVDSPLTEDAAFAVLRALDTVPVATSDAWVDEALRQAAARGITRIVDFEMAWNLESWTRRAATRPLAARVDFGIYPQDLARALDEGLTTGREIAGLLRVGSLKIISDGSLTTRTACCVDPYPGTADRGVLNVNPLQLTDLLATARGHGLHVAVHAIGDEANRLALDAFAISRAGGSIEHAQLLRHADAPRFADLGIVASVQPEHAMDDRDAAEALWPARTGRAFPLRTLLDAGATLAFGSDAPDAPLDPWQAISAAVFRTRDERAPWHPEQRITLDEAVAASVDSAIAPGSPADIAILDGDPVGADAAALRAMPVAATMVDGRWTHGPS